MFLVTKARCNGEAGYSPYRISVLRQFLSLYGEVRVNWTPEVDAMIVNTLEFDNKAVDI